MLIPRPPGGVGEAVADMLAARIASLSPNLTLGAASLRADDPLAGTAHARLSHDRGGATTC